MDLQNLRLLQKLMADHTDLDHDGVEMLSAFVGTLDEDTVFKMTSGLNQFAEYLNNRQMAEKIVGDLAEETMDEEERERLIEASVRGIVTGERLEYLHAHSGDDDEGDGNLMEVDSLCSEEHEPVDADKFPDFEALRLRPGEEFPNAPFYVHAEVAVPILMHGAASKSFVIIPCGDPDEAQHTMHVTATSGAFHRVQLHDHAPSIRPNLFYLVVPQDRLDGILAEIGD